MRSLDRFKMQAAQHPKKVYVPLGALSTQNTTHSNQTPRSHSAKFRISKFSKSRDRYSDENLTEDIQEDNDEKASARKA